MSNFRIGQKVVCVNSRCRDGRFWGGDIPVEGAVYTVRAIAMCEPIESCLGVKLVEIENSVGGFDDFYYRAARFRPVAEKSTDTGMAILKKLLEPTKVDA